MVERRRLLTTDSDSEPFFNGRNTALNTEFPPAVAYTDVQCMLFNGLHSVWLLVQSHPCCWGPRQLAEAFSLVRCSSSGLCCN
jgi:hypothetical protein